MRNKKKFVVFFILLFLFCSFYRFVCEGRNDNNSFYELLDFTVNTQGYLSFVHTATFYSLFFVFFLNGRIIKLKSQNLIRQSRELLHLKNLLICFLYSLLFGLIFCIPHLIFMCFNFGTNILLQMNFFAVLAAQLLSLVIYYLLTSTFMIFLYYCSSRCVLSGIITYLVNAVLMFVYKLLKVYTPICATLVFTDYYNHYQSLASIIVKSIALTPLIMALIIIARIQIKMKDVL